MSLVNGTQTLREVKFQRVQTEPCGIDTHSSDTQDQELEPPLLPLPAHSSQAGNAVTLLVAMGPRIFPIHHDNVTTFDMNDVFNALGA